MSNLRVLKPHQKAMIEFIRVRDGQAGVFSRPGTMKTLAVLRYARLFKPALILCRRDDYMTWFLELTSDNVIASDIQQLDGSKNTIVIPQKPWVICSYDIAKNPLVAKQIVDLMWGIVIADEAHYIRHWTSRRTKQIIRITRHIYRRIPMTGTPIGNSMMDAWALGMFIDDGRTFGDDFEKFQNEYFIQPSGTRTWVPRRGARKKIQYKLRGIAVGFHEDDVLKLPPIRNIVKSCKMTVAQRKAQDQCLDDWEIDLENGVTMELNYIIQRITKLRQIASGFIYDEDKVPHWFSKKGGKISMLRKLIRNDDYLKDRTKIVLWCAYTAEIERIMGMLEQESQKYVPFYGKMNRKKKNEARTRFKNDSKCRFFVGQVDSGVGMNELAVSYTAVYVSNSEKVISRQQSKARTRRGGSEIHDFIEYWDLVTENSVDVQILSALSRNIKIADDILAKLKRGYKPRNII